MAEKAFSQIKEAEAHARELIKNANEEASQIIKSAEKSAEDSFLHFSDTCKQEFKEKKLRTENDLQADSIEFSNETARLCEELKEKLLMQKSKAVDEIIKIITEHV